MLYILDFTECIGFWFSTLYQLYFKKLTFSLQFMNVDIVSEDQCTKFLDENNVMLPRQFKNYLLCARPSTGKLDVDEVCILLWSSHENDPILVPILARNVPDSHSFGTMLDFLILVLFYHQIMREFMILILFKYEGGRESYFSIFLFRTRKHPHIVRLCCRLNQRYLSKNHGVFLSVWYRRE